MTQHDEARLVPPHPLPQDRCAGCDRLRPAPPFATPWPVECRTDLASLARRASGPSPHRVRGDGSAQVWRLTGAEAAAGTQGRALRWRPRPPQCDTRHAHRRTDHRRGAANRAARPQADGRSPPSTLHRADARVPVYAYRRPDRAARRAQRSPQPSVRRAPLQLDPLPALRHRRRDRGRARPGAQLRRPGAPSPCRTACRSRASSPN